MPLGYPEEESIAVFPDLGDRSSCPYPKRKSILDVKPMESLKDAIARIKLSSES